MNIDTLKLQLMREFLEIQDRQVLQHLIDVVIASRKSESSKPFEAYDSHGNLVDEDYLMARVENAKNDRLEEKLTSIEDMEKEIEGWK